MRKNRVLASVVKDVQSIVRGIGILSLVSLIVLAIIYSIGVPPESLWVALMVPISLILVLSSYVYWKARRYLKR